MNFGSSGVGSAHQIAGALLNAKAGVSLSHVPFQGGAPAIQALAGGHIDMTFAVAAVADADGEVGSVSLDRAGGTQAL